MSVDDLLDPVETAGDALDHAVARSLRAFAAGAATVAIAAAAATAGFAVWLGRRIDVPVRIRLKR